MHFFFSRIFTYLDFSATYIDTFCFSSLFLHLLLDASVFSYIYSILLFFFAKQSTSSFLIFLLLSSFVCTLLHIFLVCDTIFLLYSILPLQGAPSYSDTCDFLLLVLLLIPLFSLQ